MHEKRRIQLLHRPPGLSVGEIVRHLLAVQAQDVTAAYLAVRARSATVTVADVEAAWRDREIVRTWGPRGTLHFVHTDDLPWLHALTRNATNTTRRLHQEGVTGDDLLPLIDRALAGQAKARSPRRAGRTAGGQGERSGHRAPHRPGRPPRPGRARSAPRRQAHVRARR